MIKLKKIMLKNYKVHKDFETVFDNDFFELKEPNEYGKSTIFEAICDAFHFDVKKIENKSTKSIDKEPVIILDMDVDNKPYTLTLNAQSQKMLFEGEDGTYLSSKESIRDFFEDRGYKMLPFVVSKLLLVKERDIFIDTQDKDMRKFTGDVFNMENLNTLIRIISDKFLSERTPGLKKNGFGDVFKSTEQNIDNLRKDIEDLEKALEEYEKSKEEYEEAKEEKRQLEGEIKEKDTLLDNIKILKDLKKKEELQKEKEKLERDLKENEDAYNALIKEKDEVTKSLKGLEKSQKEMEKRIEDNNERMREIEDLKHEKKEKEDKIKQLEKLKKELEEKKKRKEVLEKEIKELKDKKKEIEGKIEIFGQVLSLYEEIEKKQGLLKEIKDKEKALEEARAALGELLNREASLKKDLANINIQLKELKDRLNSIDIHETSDVLKEKLAQIEDEIGRIEKTLSEIEKLKEKIEEIKKNAYPWNGFGEDELEDAYRKWQSMLDQKSTGTIEVLRGSALIDGEWKKEKDTYDFENEATVEKEDLKLRVYASSSLKEVKEELEKFITHFKEIENLKNALSAIKNIKEIEIKIEALNEEENKERLGELKKQKDDIEKKIEEVKKKEKERKEIEKQIEDLGKIASEIKLKLAEIEGLIKVKQEGIKKIEDELENYPDAEELKKEIQEIKGQIKEKLISIGYDNILFYDEVKGLLSEYTEKLKKTSEDIAKKDGEFGIIQKRIEEIEKEIASVDEEKLRKGLKELKSKIKELEDALEDGNKLKEELASIRNEINDLREKLGGLLKNEGELRAKIKTLKEHIEKLEDEIRGIKVDEKALDNIPYGVVKKYDKMTSKDIEEEIQKIEEDLKALRDKLTEITGKLARLEEILKHAPDKEKLERKRNELLEHERKLERLERMKKVLWITKDVLNNLRGDIEREYLKKMQHKTGEFFSDITGGRYKVVHFKSDTFFVERNKSDAFEKRWYVEDKDGNEYTFDELSDGTKTQLLLAIRLALISLFFGKRTAFLMLDEPFAYADSEREKNARSILKRFSEKNWQILMLSAKS